MASAMKTTVVLLLVFFSLSAPVTLFPKGLLQKDKEPITVTHLQDRYDTLEAPAVVMLSASGTSAVSTDIVTQIEKELLKQLVNSGRYKPVKMQRWLLTTYDNNKANNPFSIMNAIKDEQYIYPLHYIGKPYVFYSGSHYYFVFYIYSLDTYYPLIILRQFTSLDTIEDMIASCMEEFYIRLSNPVLGGIRRRVVIDDFSMEFLRLVRHSSGEFDFITAPFIEYKGVTLRDEDDFFSRVMGYVLAATNLFQVFHVGDFKEFSNASIGGASNLADYRIQGRVQLSDYESVLYVNVIEIRSGARILSLRYPLLSYSFDEVWNIYRRISVQIIDKLFDSEMYGMVPPLKSPGRSFFANNMFIGWNGLENLVFAKGLHVIYTGTPYRIERSRKFVNSFHVLLDNESMVYTDLEGRHVWNLLGK